MALPGLTSSFLLVTVSFGLPHCGRFFDLASVAPFKPNSTSSTHPEGKIVDAVTLGRALSGIKRCLAAICAFGNERPMLVAPLALRRQDDLLVVERLSGD